MLDNLSNEEISALIDAHVASDPDIAEAVDVSNKAMSLAAHHASEMLILPIRRSCSLPVIIVEQILATATSMNNADSIKACKTWLAIRPTIIGAIARHDFESMKYNLRAMLVAANEAKAKGVV